MTSWLKWRLCTLLGGSLLMGGATYLYAQNSYPAPPSTPEEAGAQFFQLLSDNARRASVAPGSWAKIGSPAATQFNSISRPQIQSLLNRSENDGPNRFLELLTEQMILPQFDARVTETSGNQSIVEVESAPVARKREVVVVAEDGGYRLDLKATYGRWSHKSGAQLDEEWFRYTGVLSSSMQQSDDFLRTQCQNQLKQQMLGIMQYVQDYDEKYPPAREWVDVLQPYVRAEQIFQCPALPKGNGYAYNQYFSRITLASISSPATTINVYETSNPKRNWIGPGMGRAYRHLDGWNLGFADGHVKWFRREANMGSFDWTPGGLRDTMTTVIQGTNKNIKR